MGSRDTVVRNVNHSFTTLLSTNLLLYVIFFTHRYDIMQQCWLEDPNQRPPFEALVVILENLLSQHHDYDRTILPHEYLATNNIPTQQPNVIIHQVNGDSSLRYDDVHEGESFKYDQVPDENSVAYGHVPSNNSVQNDVHADESVEFDQVPDDISVNYDQVPTKDAMQYDQENVDYSMRNGKVHDDKFIRNDVIHDAEPLEMSTQVRNLKYFLENM